MGKTVLIVSEAGDTLASVAAVTGPNTITVTRLGWRRLGEAQKAQSKEAMQNIRDLGGPAFVRELQQSVKEAGGREAVEKAAARDPLSGYELGTLLTLGVKALDDGPPTTDALDDLELEVAQAAATAVLRLSRPALFESEADRGEG